MHAWNLCRSLAGVGGLGLTLILAGCDRPAATDPAAGDDLFALTVQLDWVAEPEHGAFYQAQALGYFREEGLAVTIVPGGANAYVVQKLVTGRAHIGQYDSTNSFLAIQEGVPVVNIGIVFQSDPHALLMHEDNPVRSFADLAGKRIKARPDWAFLPYLRRQYGIEFDLVPQDFGLEQLIQDPTLIQQGFYIAEPFHVQKAGVKLRWLRVSEAGFDTVNTLLAERSWVKAHPEQTRAFLRAYARGYRSYCEDDPGPAHRLMQADNPNVTPEFLEWSRAQILAGNLAKGDPAEGAAGEYVRFSLDRVRRQIAQLEAIGLLRPGAVRAEAAFDPTFLP